eukprot:GILI01016465.1.p1 GENE.GILI01016465.1~~GILI01016465.1.p1  ORF type:complete len:285 (-),score=40.61 GILI01016465.1:75-929(-)
MQHSSAIAGMGLHMAAHNGDATKLRHLLRHAVPASADGQPSPSLVSEVDGEERYTDVNHRDFDEHTPLHIACIFGHAEAAEVLIERGADLHAEDENGQTPLHYAARYCREGCAKSLLLAGCDASQPDKQYLITPLHFAATHGNIKLMRMLLSLATDEQPSNGAVSLPLPSEIGSLLPTLPLEEQADLQAIRSLNKSVVDINAKTKGGETALHDAAQHRQVDAMQLLLAFAGKEGRLEVNGQAGIHHLTPLQIVRQWSAEDAKDGVKSVTASQKELVEALLVQAA